MLNLMKRKSVYFIHINKTGGTYVQSILNRCKKGFKIKYLGHQSNILKLPSDAFFFFTFRDPFNRMCSSVYQVFRSSGNNNYFEKYLRLFTNENDLIEAICDPTSPKHDLAQSIYNTFPHLSKSYWDFFISKEYLCAKLPRLLVAIETENLSHHLQILLSDLGKIQFDDNWGKNNTYNLGRDSKNKMPQKFKIENHYNNFVKMNKNEYDFYEFIKNYSRFDLKYRLTIDRLKLNI